MTYVLWCSTRSDTNLVGQVSLVQGQQAASMEDQRSVGSANAILQQRCTTDDADLQHVTAQHSTPKHAWTHITDVGLNINQ
jgi:hypothetical protein